MEHDHGAHLEIHTLKRSIALVVSFMIFEFLGGWYSGSLALMTDAAHMLTDAGALLLSLFVLWIARKPSTPKMSYGYHRAEILGAFLSGLFIWFLAGVLLYEAYQRWFHPVFVAAPWVVAIGALGLLVNVLMVRLFSHSHEGSLAIKAAYLHVWMDLLGSVIAVISGGVIWITGWTRVDPLLASGVALLVLFSSWKLIVEAVEILMEATPRRIGWDKVRKALLNIPEIKEVHDLHVWTVSKKQLALSVHLVSFKERIALQKANQLLRKEFSIKHTTVQVEHPDAFDRGRCFDCHPVKESSSTG